MGASSDQNLHAESPAFPALSGRNEKSYPRTLGPAVSSPQCRRRTEVDANDAVVPVGGGRSRGPWAVRVMRRANTPPGRGPSPTPRPEAFAPLYLKHRGVRASGLRPPPSTGGFHAHRRHWHVIINALGRAIPSFAQIAVHSPQIDSGGFSWRANTSALTASVVSPMATS
jgi:hypothetical protein